MIVDVIIDADTKAIVSRSQRTNKQAYDNAFRRGKKRFADAVKAV